MALKYNGTSPTAIKYNGTDLTVLKYGTTAVWGKPYSLSISAGANTTVTVVRTSSPNQGASTGALSSGSVVYYGDVLKISYSVSSGYKINTATVNGSTFSSGASFTVTGAVSVVTTAVASASWKTVWTGSKTFKMNNNYSAENLTVSSLSGVVSGRPTRITGTFSWYEEYNMMNPSSIQFSNLEIGKYYSVKSGYTSGTASDFEVTTSPNNTYVYWGLYSVGNSSLTIRYKGASTASPAGYYALGISNSYITKIEQYY